ncbi:hypothetical protein CBR_g28089 [Chara braunii]|uniref:CR-type domain-containing protein n=1 Tax=Chara braunii TaxID=69332 RepID=A0A388L9A1_CHABU|nr:hypothetical protein CBR_g28089 [Chara braunii]|eukprot:GBG78864.1 hypothetical protein CBR_g28089 [Chara braunii]
MATSRLTVAALCDESFAVTRTCRGSMARLNAQPSCVHSFSPSLGRACEGGRSQYKSGGVLSGVGVVVRSVSGLERGSSERYGDANYPGGNYGTKNGRKLRCLHDSNGTVMTTSGSLVDNGGESEITVSHKEVMAKEIGSNQACEICEAVGSVICHTCSGSGLYVEPCLESQGVIVRVRCLGCGGGGRILCASCGGRGHH